MNYLRTDRRGNGEKICKIVKIELKKELKKRFEKIGPEKMFTDIFTVKKISYP